MRKIIHIDMDAFYASIEQRDNPEYIGKPLVVGYPGNRGVVSAASYEARKYGVYSAMSSKMALQKCPHLIFAPTRFDVYKYVSYQIRKIFFEFTDKVEPLSLDEAFLDVTENHKEMDSATQIAKEIKAMILKETNLTASAGVSFNKFLAKIASDYNKPNGLFIITPKKAEKFIENLEIEKFFGIGKVTAKKMHDLGIYKGIDLKQKTERELIQYFGKAGSIYYLNSRGIDNREVKPDRIRKSVGAENTFLEDIDSLFDVQHELKQLAIEVIRRIEKSKFKGRTITLKIKYADFKVITRSKTLFNHVVNAEFLYKIAIELLSDVDLSKKIRLLGLSIKNIDEIEEEDSSNQIIKEGTQLKIPFKEFNFQ